MFTGGFQERHQRHMNIEGILLSHLMPHLTDCLNKGLALDVADGTADFGNHDVCSSLFTHAVNEVFDLVCDVRNGLYRCSQIFATALLGEDIGIDLTRGQIGVFVQVLVDEALVMTKVQICLGTVFRHINFSVLIGTHGAGVNIDIRVQLLRGHFQSARFQQTPKRCRCNSLAQTGHNAAGHKNILCHNPSSRTETA